MSGSLFSSEVVGRALMFLLSQPSITIFHRNLYRPLVQIQLHHPTLFGCLHHHLWRMFCRS